MDRICALREKIVDYVEEASSDLDRVNVRDMGEFVDMIKDLSEAEKLCAEAHYYKSVSDGMENYSAEKHGDIEEDMIGILQNKYRSLSHNDKLIFRNDVLKAVGAK